MEMVRPFLTLYRTYTYSNKATSSPFNTTAFMLNTTISSNNTSPANLTGCNTYNDLCVERSDIWVIAVVLFLFWLLTIIGTQIISHKRWINKLRSQEPSEIQDWIRRQMVDLNMDPNDDVKDISCCLGGGGSWYQCV